MRFADIPGLDEVKDRLIRSVKSGKVAHAQLFIGREGALNLPLALAYATFIQCTDRGDKDACGVCAACSKNLKYIHPDMHFVFPVSNVKGDKDEDRFRADIMKSWRSFLLEQPFGNLSDWTSSYGGEDKQAIISKEESRNIVKNLSLKPFESAYKVMIIWQPEAMHPSAANGILKILEEPPAQTFFFLVSNNPERLLPTTLSRTQQVIVPQLSDEALDQYLGKTATLETKQRHKITATAEGNLRLAMDLMERPDDDLHEQLAQWLRACYKRNYAAILPLMDEFHEFDRMRQQEFLQYGLTILRESLLAISGADNLHRMSEGEQKFINDFSKVMTVTKLEKSAQLINEATYHLERNGSAKMIFLDLSLELGKCFQSV